MAVAHGEPARLERRRMSYDEFLALPADVRAEYVDGEVIVSPPADWEHQSVAFRVARAIDGALPDLVTVTEAGVATAEWKRRIPDVAVAETMPGELWAEQPLVIAVEVLSPGTRTEDTLRKSGEYQQAGVGQYWIVDREHRRLTVLLNTGTEWAIAHELDEQQPVAEVEVAGHGTVPLDLGDILVTPSRPDR